MTHFRFINFGILFFILIPGTSCRKIFPPGKDNFGNNSLISISPANLKAGTSTVVEITFRVPEGGIEDGGSILLPFYMKPWNGLIRGISNDKKTNSLVAADRSDGGKLEIMNIPVNKDFDIISNLQIFIRGKRMEGGEKIFIRFGTFGQNVVVQRKQVSFYFEAELDAEGKGVFHRLVPPYIPVVESEPASLHLTAPSHVKAGEEFKVVAYAEDEFHNVCENYKGYFTLRTFDDNSGESLGYRMRTWTQHEDLNRNEIPYVFEKTGTYYIQATDRENNLIAISNPVKVFNDMPEFRIFWGEIHVHSQLSDGRGELQDLYRDGYARGLDFTAITDHGFGRGNRGSLEERITEICVESDRFNRPGKYITIPAGETHYFPIMHMNFYFDRSDTSHILSLLREVNQATEDGLGKIWQNMPDENLSLEAQLYWDVFRQQQYSTNTLAFPHHTMWLGIKPFLDPERMRVIEIFSIHGSSEFRIQDIIPQPLRMKADRIAGNQDRKFPVIELLNEGMHLGFAGGSDNHDGQTGFNAITAIYSNELSRKAIIDALYDQRCYATSANRTLIDINKKDSIYHCTVNGDGKIDLVEIVADGTVVYRNEAIDESRVEFDWEPINPDSEYFYLRVTLDGGHEAAWSSPVWLD
ncbi:MAG TPA: hypothetical protein VI583_05045 [Cyclobacteriaceae bacterium]|nr:hypothetical protein [Cyclobacteriaceae bacterium]